MIAEFGHQGPKEIGASKEFNAWLYDSKKMALARSPWILAVTARPGRCG